MCGVFGAVASDTDKELAQKIYIGLYGLQHRGKESAGIVVFHNGQYWSHLGMGEIAMVFRGGVLEKVPGISGIGHTRYSTAGVSDISNIQPIREFWRDKEYWVGHVGQIPSAELRNWCEGQGAIFATTSDTGVIAKTISLMPASSFKEAVIKTFLRLEGAFSIVILCEGELIVMRDTFGFRPLSIGAKNKEFFVSSETGAFIHLNAKFIRDVEPGEIAVINSQGITTLRRFRSSNRKFCIFEFIYFLRPDSRVFGRRARAVRERMGRFLFLEHPARGDMVIGVPDSGEDAGRGFIRASGITDGREALFRNHNISRTFIEPIKEKRKKSVDLKFVFFEEYLAGKTIIVVDDSLVRATTMERFIARLRKKGASGVHVRISSPMYRCPCFYGIDTYQIEDELAAVRYNGDIEKIREEIKADSLGYLSLENVVKAIMETPGDPITPFDFCAACFSGDYPVPFDP